MIKPEWTFMLDNQATAWECVCGALNSISREKCGKCGKIKEVKFVCDCLKDILKKNVKKKNS